MKTIKFFSILIILLNNYISNAQIIWQKSLGGTGQDYANSIQQTNDGGYIIAGYSDSNDGNVTGNHGGYDYWIVKIDATGNIQWQKSLGGTGNELTSSIQQTIDGGYIVCGATDSNDGDVTGNLGQWDYWIVKLDATGNIEWQKTLGGTNEDKANSISQTSDGGYIIAGYSASNDGDVTGNLGYNDYWIVKIDNAGTIQWQKSIGGTFPDDALAIQQTSDGGYIVAGTSTSNDIDVSGNHGEWDYWIVKLDTTGNIQWQKSLGGTSLDVAYSIQQTYDGGYIVAGRSYSNDGDVSGNIINIYTDYWIVKIDTTGNIQWQKCMGGPGYDEAYSIQQTYDEGYIVTGHSDSIGGNVTENQGGIDYWMVKFDATGNVQWQKSLGGTDDEDAESIQQTNDGGYIIAGTSTSNDGDVTGNHGSWDYWIVKYEGTTGIEEMGNDHFDIYPNPAISTLHVSALTNINKEVNCQILNMLGEIVAKNNTGHKAIAIDVSALTHGLYFIQLQNGNEKMVKRFVKE